MAGMGDVARMMAAGGGGTAADAEAPDMEAMDPNAPEDPGMMAGSPTDAIEQGISMIESALESLPGDLAEKARKHLEGLKEIVAQGDAAGQSPDDEAAEGDQPEGANAGQIESPSEPQVGGSAMGY